MLHRCVRRRVALVLAYATAHLAIGSISVHAQNAVTRVSVDSNGNEGDFHSLFASISGDGRYVAFSSDASNLVSPPPTARQIYVHDRITGTTTCVSVDSSGTIANGFCGRSSISGDGRFVAFDSSATNLVVGDFNGVSDVFLRDRDPDGNGIFDEGNGTTVRASVDSNGAEGNQASELPSLSANGGTVAFMSRASNLVSGDGNGYRDVFVRDLIAGTTVCASVDSNGSTGDGQSQAPALSDDGTCVAFSSSATNLVAGDTNAFFDVFVRDLAAGTTTRVSVDSNGAEANYGGSDPLDLSGDGLVVSFVSGSDNLVAGDTNGDTDLFVHDRASGVTTRASVDSKGNEANGFGFSGESALTYDGSLVVFGCEAANLVPTDDNVFNDIFVHDRSTGATMRIDAAWDVGETDDRSWFPSVSADGSAIAFHSDASNLVSGDGNGSQDVFVFDFTAPRPDASWSNYGAGYAGTNGVPTLTCRADPVIGTSFTIDIGNSLGTPTYGALFAGAAQTDIPLKKGGHLLVVPSLVVVLPIGSTGLSIDADLPSDEAICGIEFFVQVIELDGGATFGLSFTPGLDLFVGI